jgi:hypothetical protein
MTTNTSISETKIISMYDCKIGEEYSLATEPFGFETEPFEYFIQFTINGDAVIPTIGYNFGKLLEINKIDHAPEEDCWDEYYSFTSVYVFENGTIKDTHYPNRIEEAHSPVMLIASTK